jgi:hypothetical protein
MEFKVVCGNCQAEPEVVADASGELILCPSCGQHDDLDTAQRMAGDHFIHQMIPDLRNRIESLRGSSPPFELSPGHPPSSDYRWHAAPP